MEISQNLKSLIIDEKKSTQSLSLQLKISENLVRKIVKESLPECYDALKKNGKTKRLSVKRVVDGRIIINARKSVSIANFMDLINRGRTTTEISMSLDISRTTVIRYADVYLPEEYTPKLKENNKGKNPWVGKLSHKARLLSI